MTKNRAGLFSLTFLSLSGLAIYAYVGNFTRMLADDFCSIYYADRLGLFRSVYYWYLKRAIHGICSPTLCYSVHYGIQVVGPPYSE